MNLKYLGIFREAEHSPERVVDDELILKAVAQHLSEQHDVEVKLIFPGKLKEIKEEPNVIFNMAEEEPVLQKLEEFEHKGIRVVNSVQGVRNTFRKKMTTILAHLPFVPETVLCSTDSPMASFLPGTDFSAGVWIKRGDYHAIEKDDVIFAQNLQGIERIVGSFKKRGIKTVIMQKHIQGDLIKFYGIREPKHGTGGNTRWFHWFYHKDQELKNYPFSREELRSRCEHAADTLLLEVFGGDAIVTQKGKIFIIDVNAWPSFALFRDTAAKHIAHHLKEKGRAIHNDNNSRSDT